MRAFSKRAFESINDAWVVDMKFGVAPKLGKHFHRNCDDVGATRKFVVYAGEDEFPVGNGVHNISLKNLCSHCSPNLCDLEFRVLSDKIRLRIAVKSSNID